MNHHEPVAWLEIGEDELGRPKPITAHINEPDIGGHRKVPLYTIPEGWQLVPIEPTDEMLSAAHEADREYTLRNFGDIMTVQQGAYDHYIATKLTGRGTGPND